MAIVKNTRRVPSKSIFESLAVNFYVQSNRYQIRRSWPASSKFQINIVYSTKKKETQKRRRRRKREEMRWDDIHPELDGGFRERQRRCFHLNFPTKSAVINSNTIFKCSQLCLLYCLLFSSHFTTYIVLSSCVSVCVCVCVYFGFLLRFDKITAF